jgi:hypothetical protein
MRDSESLVFALPVTRHRSPLDYLGLYVEFGVLMLTSEKSKAPR